MTLKRKQDREDDYAPSDRDLGYRPQPKRARAKINSSSSNGGLYYSSPPVSDDADFIVPDDFSEDELAPTPRKQTLKGARPQKSRPLRSHTQRAGRSNMPHATTHPVEDHDYQSARKPSQRTLNSVIPATRDAKRRANLAAELANLADYNKPPLSRSRTRKTCDTSAKYFSASDSDDEYTPKATRSPRKASTPNDHLHVQGSRITKPQATNPSRSKRNLGNRLLAEVEQLQPWHGWDSEEDNSSESESEMETKHTPLPKVHSRHYAPKVPGTQNVPWSALSGELRNEIYKYAMSNEEEKTLNVVHYPDGVPRRSVRGISSTTNFAHSYWGFTQTCQQVRNEFTPWLLEKRRVRTPLGTLNHYVDTFHRPDQVGNRAGWVEPICRGAALPEDGVEFLKTLEHTHANPGFHLQLDPTTVSPVLEYLAHPTDPNDFDELKIMRDMNETFTGWSCKILPMTGIEGIHITSIVKEDRSDPNDSEDDDSHEILIKLDIDRPQAENITHQQQLQSINRFIFASQIAQKEGVKLQASFNNGIARWMIRRPGIIDMQWKQRKNRGANMFRRLTLAPDEPESFIEEKM